MSTIPCSEYTDELESLFKSECEKSECLAILHSQSYIKYSRFSVAINIPVIILSSFVGFISNINVKANGKDVFNGQFGPAVSKDPFLNFKYKGAKGDKIVVNWVDSN